MNGKLTVRTLKSEAGQPELLFFLNSLLESFPSDAQTNKSVCLKQEYSETKGVK